MWLSYVTSRKISSVDGTFGGRCALWCMPLQQYDQCTEVTLTAPTCVCRWRAHELTIGLKGEFFFCRFPLIPRFVQDPPLLSELAEQAIDCRYRNLTRVDHVCPSEQAGLARESYAQLHVEFGWHPCCGCHLRNGLSLSYNKSW